MPFSFKQPMHGLYLYSMKKLVFLFLFPLSFAVSAQHAPTELAERWNQASLPWFHQKISQRLSTNKPCPPTFKEQIAAPSALEQALLTIPSNKELEMEYIDLLLSQNCERFLEIQSLADLYFPLLHKHLDRVEMDRDYAFLTMVLSGLNPTFRNSSDQAGLWALDFVNAKRQGLHIDQDIDERRAASLATEATTELLRAYFEVFEMNHIKTIAAHVKGAKWTNARKESEIVADLEMFQVFTALKVCMRLRGNFERENQLVFWLNELNSFDAIPIADTIYKEALVQVLGLKKSTFEELNPAYIGNRLPAPHREVPIIIPVEKMELFLSMADSLYQWKPPVKAKEKIVESGKENEYIVRSGDVLGKIADNFGVRVSQIMDWNNLRSDRINVGQRLLIYTADKAQNKSKATSEPRASNKVADRPPNSNETETYTVKSGDSLWQIAQKFPGVSAEDIMKWNKISTDIRPGQKLIIHSPK